MLPRTDIKEHVDRAKRIVAIADEGWDFGAQMTAMTLALAMKLRAIDPAGRELDRAVAIIGKQVREAFAALGKEPEAIH
jgi:hypothetical protein